MKKRAQRRRKLCRLAVVSQHFCVCVSKISTMPQTPFLGAQHGQNLISWRWSLPKNPVWWGSMHPISSYHGNRPTHTQTHTHPQTGPITIHCAAASVQCHHCKPLWEITRHATESTEMSEVLCSLNWFSDCYVETATSTAKCYRPSYTSRLRVDSLVKIGRLVGSHLLLLPDNTTIQLSTVITH